MSDLESPDQILLRVDRPITGATGLPNSQYTSPASFEQDRDHVVTPGWAGLAFQDELPQPGCILPVEFMGLPLVVTRDANNTIRVFHNVCSHRGTRLAGDRCKTAGTIRCPYHSWTYRLDGTLCGTPHIGGFGIHSHPDFDPVRNGLREVRSQCWLGTIFINLSGDAPSFHEATAPIRQSWSAFLPDPLLRDMTTLCSAGEVSLQVRANWKLAVENYLEAYHLPTIHPGLNRISPLRHHEPLDNFGDGAGQRSLNYARSNIGARQLPVHPRWPGEKIDVAEYPVLFPNTFFGIHADHIFILLLRPLRHDCTSEHGRVFYFGESAESPLTQANRDAVRNAWDAVFQEDVSAVEALQAGRASPAYGGGAFSPVMDKPTHHFHRWVARKLAA